MFNSSAGALVAGDTSNSNDVFVKNGRGGAITRVSTTRSGAQITSGAAYLGTSVALQVRTGSSSGGTI